MVRVAFGLQDAKVPEIREAFGEHLATTNPGNGAPRDATVPEIKEWVRRQIAAVVIAHRRTQASVDETDPTED